MPGRSLLDHRVILVSGKGGVGKSTIACGLGLAAAARGKRVVLVEMGGATAIHSMFGARPEQYAVRELRPNLSAISVTPAAAMEEYLVRELRMRALYQLVFRNRFIEPFMNAALGITDLISVGKVMDLEWEREDGSLGPDARGPYRWDLIIVDAPATGHGVGMLRAGQAMMDIARVGPLYQNAQLIHRLLTDRARTGLLMVTIPEEMAINEAREMERTLAADAERVALAGVVVNGAPEPPLGEDDLADWARVRAHLGTARGSIGQAVDEVERACEREQRVTGYLAELARDIPADQVRLPLYPSRQLVEGQLQDLGRRLLEGLT